MKQEKGWKTLFIVFVNVIVLSCPEDTINVPEKSILRLPKAESTWQRESVARFADSWPT